jgi:hypothetical protein
MMTRMADVTDIEQREALRIAVEMVEAKYRDSSADVAPLAEKFVTGGATPFDCERRMGLICVDLASLAGSSLIVALNGKRILGTVGRVTCTDRLRAVPETA